jgi:hypothetical protein
MIGGTDETLRNNRRQMRFKLSQRRAPCATRSRWRI